MKEKPYISIVDDDENVRSSIGSYFRAAGLHIHTFDSAESFLACIDDLRTDCLVTDLHMPGIDGLALQRRLRQAGYWFPVIFLTAFATAGARRQAQQFGAAVFLEKPVDPDDLLVRVEEALR